jgi:hypothetical protein
MVLNDNIKRKIKMSDGNSVFSVVFYINGEIKIGKELGSSFVEKYNCIIHIIEDETGKLNYIEDIYVSETAASIISKVNNEADNEIKKWTQLKSDVLKAFGNNKNVINVTADKITKIFSDEIKQDVKL